MKKRKTTDANLQRQESGGRDGAISHARLPKVARLRMLCKAQGLVMR